MSEQEFNNKNTSGPPSPWEVERRLSYLERRISLLEQSTQNIQHELAKINANTSKLVWIVGSAILLGGINMLMTNQGAGILS